MFSIGDYEFDTEKQVLQIHDKKQKLTYKEAELLRLLCLHKNAILERELALKLIWGEDTFFNGRSMDVFITKLRKYLKEDSQLQIVNVHGKGFKLVVAWKWRGAKSEIATGNFLKKINAKRKLFGIYN